MNAYFSSSLAHLSAEMQRIDTLLKRYVKQALDTEAPDNPYPGLQVTAQDAQTLLNDTLGQPAWRTPTENGTPLAPFAHDSQIFDHDRASRLTENPSWRLESLRTRFQLTPMEVDILLLCLIVEWDPRYSVFYAYLHNDVNKNELTLDLMLTLLSQNGEEKWQIRQCFAATASLIRYALIEIRDQDKASRLSRTAQVSERVTDFLLEQDGLPVELTPTVTVITPDTPLSDLILPDSVLTQLASLITLPHDDLSQAIIYLQGVSGAGKRTLAAALCQALQIKLLVVDLPAFMQEQPKESLSLILREAYLQQAAIYWKALPSALAPHQKTWLKPILAASQVYRGLIFMAGDSTWHWPHALTEGKQARLIHLPPLTAAQRQKVWQQALPSLDHNTAKTLSERFKFTPGQIMSVAQMAGPLHQVNDSASSDIGVEVLYQACQLHTSETLSTLARPMVPNEALDTVILPCSCQQQLDDLLSQVQYATTVYEQWGFARQLTRGKGLTALFFGPPGTGKTRAAEVVASRLRLTLYKIDLALMVSKYIGETEKNLDRLFEEAQSHQGILFFDEADALFGKRSPVQKGHDRYANLQTSYLLQKIEDCPGIVILATNFKHNLDEAFIRRFQFCIDFPFPETRERQQIWQTIFPKETPLSPEICFSDLAKLELAGGHIKNIALAAAFKAASDVSAGPVQVTLEHIKTAAQQEFKKMGKILHPEEWGFL